MAGTGKRTAKKSPTSKSAATVKRAATKKTASGEKKVVSARRPPKSGGANVRKSYSEAKKAFENLWSDIAKESHTKFSSLAAKIEAKYTKARQSVSEGDIRHALDKGETAATKMLKSGIGWVQHLGAQVKLLYELLSDSVHGKFKAPWATIAAVTAALLYVIMPIDVIPDFIPGIGLIDDAFVISMCVSLIRIDLRKYAKLRKLDLAAFGL